MNCEVNWDWPSLKVSHALDEKVGVLITLTIFRMILILWDNVP